MKPRIYKWGLFWICTTDRLEAKETAFGYTPNDAYASWCMKHAIYGVGGE